MRPPNTLYRLLVLLIACFVVIGCDSSDSEDEEPTADSEQFLGEWAVSTAFDQNGQRDQTSVFSSVGTLSITYDPDGSFLLFLDYADPEQTDLGLDGTYTVDEAMGQVTLSSILLGTLEFVYQFNNDSELVLTGDLSAIAVLLETELDGDVVLTLLKVDAT